MKIKVLFIHNNFPAQYRRLSEFLAKEDLFEVHAIGSDTAREVPGVTLQRYRAQRSVSRDCHPFAWRFAQDCSSAEQVMFLCQAIAMNGFTPDVIFVHPGWGEALPLFQVFPSARIISYAEFYYRATGTDVGFDTQYPPLGLDGRVRIELRNAAQLLSLSESHRLVSPTHWQKSLFPKILHPAINVIHDGIDTSVAAPNPSAVFELPNGRQLTKNDKVLTYVSRSLEPLRGIHIFLETLTHLMPTLQDLEVVIVGKEPPSYGASAPDGLTWRQIFFDKFSDRMDLNRVHVFEHLPYNRYLSLLQVSSTHFYYTYPFVLSWSLLEAMACGAVIVGSDTPPVAEVIDHGHTGYLLPFFDASACAQQIEAIMANREAHAGLGENARRFVSEHFDFQRNSLPAYLRMIEAELDPANRS